MDVRADGMVSRDTIGVAKAYTTKYGTKRRSRRKSQET
jgi:hypothetical protein